MQRSRELAEAIGELQENVVWNELTGLASRSRFEQLITERIRESWPIGRAFHVLFIDLDDFKSVNDTLGHEALLSPAVGCVADRGGHRSTGSRLDRDWVGTRSGKTPKIGVASGSSSGVEHLLPKQRVVGSNPISRSNCLIRSVYGVLGS